MSIRLWLGRVEGGGINSSGVLDISKNGEVAKFQPATSGNHTLVNFNSKVNSGSDKGFILVQDESTNSPGTSGEDLRMTVGVYNDFKQSASHSDELWFQGGCRLCYNVGEWDSELNTIIGDPGSGLSHGGVKHEWRINNSTKMTLDNYGNLGIGGLPVVSGLTIWNGLRVNGIEFGQHTYGGSAGLYPSQGYGGTKPIAPFRTNFSAYFAWTTRAPAYLAFSDERIKSNIVDIHDTTALDQLRQLQPKYYEYVDKVGRGSSTIIGFIAQEVKDVVPEAVSVADGDIPNIYETANVSANAITFTNFHTSNLDATSNTLVVYEGGDTRKELTIVEIVDEHTIRVDTDIAEEDVFVYGQVVQDFHHLNKDYLWTIATSALQEVDRQLQQENARNDRLEARLQAFRNETLKGFPLPPIGETPTLLRPAVPCLNFADLRELKGTRTGVRA